MKHPTKGRAVVVQPDEAESYWQPVPANGYAEVRISRRNVPGNERFSMGMQVIAPACHIREHQHDANEELLVFIEGGGKVIVDGVEHPIVPGTTVYLGPWSRHRIVNEGPTDLKMLWMMLPGGLEDFFEAIGRPRSAGEPAPEPFPRPTDVEEIEARTVFARLDQPSTEAD